VVVRGVKAGAQSLSTAAGPTANDPNAANNTATTAITVERRVALKCNVPSLKGLTKAVAKRLLTAVHCKLGKVTRKTARSGTPGTVIKQAKKAGAKLPAGSKVNVTLRK
jgi:beta-lactam-binding protein with PASTA domain